MMNYEQLTASQWYVMMSKDSIDDNTRQAFRGWLAADVNNELAYLECQIALQVLDGLQEAPEIQQLLQSTEASLPSMASDSKPKNWLGWLKQHPWPAPVLASVLTGICVFALLFNNSSKELDTGLLYMTSLGEQQTIELNDGSKVNLNTDSQLRVAYETERRYLQLHQGEATFSVQHDPTRPFDVIAGNRIIRAIGTRFNVYVDQGKVTVSVLEGKIKVASELHELDSNEVIHAGFATQYDAVSKYNRYSAPKLVIKDASLDRLNVVGVFNIGDTESLLNALQTAFPIEVSRTAEQIELYSR